MILEKSPKNYLQRSKSESLQGCLGAWIAHWIGYSVHSLSQPFIRQGQVGCGPRMWAIVVGHRKPWMSGGSHLPAQQLCVAAMQRLQPRPKHAYCAGLKGHYNPSPYVPAAPRPTTSIHTSLWLHVSRAPLTLHSATLLHTSYNMTESWNRLPLWSKHVLLTVWQVCYLTHRGGGRLRVTDSLLSLYMCW